MEDYDDNENPSGITRTIEIGNLADLSDTALTTAMDINWKQRDIATKTLTQLTAASIMRRTLRHLPETAVIVLREDTSHLPAHGHVDDILDKDGNSCMPHHEDWHDLEWTHEVDEDVWDIYYFASQRFTTEPDGVRRLRISL